MPIGTSDGETFKDQFEMVSQPAVSPETGLPRVYIDTGTQVPPDENNAPAGSVGPSGGIVDDVVRPEPYGLNPPERETPFPRPRMTQIVSGLLDSAKKAMSLTEAPQWAMDPVTGEFHTSPQAIESAAELAQLAVMGPAPMASKLGVDGTLGSFAGVKSKTLDKTALYKAQNMTSDGVHPDDIFKETGFYRSADGRWRQEIDDSKSNILETGTKLTPAEQDLTWDRVGKAETIRLKAPPLREDGTPQPRFLSDVLHHPELFKAYPHLKEVKMLPVEDKSYWGSYNSASNTIRMAELPSKDFHTTLMHEVQHAIQNYEGFVGGANSKMFEARELPAAIKQLEEAQKIMVPEIMKDFGFTDPTQLGFLKHLIKEDAKAPLIGGLKDAYDYHKKTFPLAFKRLENIAKAEELIRKNQEEAYEMYRRVMGEVEANNVITRLEMNEVTRRLRAPSQTQDFPNWQQIDPNQAR